jgi:fumarylpyruvate hydrolase
MLFDVPRLLGYLASLAPLEPGDLVFTGTPEGVGPLRRGDRFEMTLRSPGGGWAFPGVF